ncbi:hypothetical protein Agabi119p4_2132 [Agaricus bisporus var. burnettii]|uniref:Uncharacterized protein n=1 Tax=Agaricus bisporus var. burnettii TaxID=192524 RepID=A0A8H7F8G6_AGABI|nr:hypothetical protein Agabi119p4_2132 [Agaricus bisporus var. burnettii]
MRELSSFLSTPGFGIRRRAPASLQAFFQIVSRGQNWNSKNFGDRKFRGNKSTRIQAPSGHLLLDPSHNRGTAGYRILTISVEESSLPSSLLRDWIGQFSLPANAQV